MPPYEDELASSWLARNALFYGMKPSQLSRLIYENSDLWKSDMDVYIRDENIDILSKKLNVNRGLIQKATIFHSCDHFYPKSGKTPQIRWVMPIGIGASKKRFGLQYCSECLREDRETPYFRKYWRLAFMTACVKHRVQLQDRCPRCAEPISLKRPKKQLDSVLFSMEDLAFCSKCDFDLRDLESTYAEDQELRINEIHHQLLVTGYGVVGGVVFNYSNLYFEGARRILTLLVSNPKGEKLYSQLLIFLQGDNISQREVTKQSEVEITPIKLRRTGLKMLYCLLMDWPNKFKVACWLVKVTTNDIYSTSLSFPFWLDDIIKSQIKISPFVISYEEKESIKKYFKEVLDREIMDYEIGKLVKKHFGQVKSQ